MTTPAAILLGLAMAAAALLADHFVRAYIRRRNIAEAKEKALAIVEKAEAEAKLRMDEAALEARVTVTEAQTQADRVATAKSEELEKARRDIQSQDRNLQRKAQLFEERLKNVENRETILKQKEAELAGLNASAEKMVGEQHTRLEQISGYSAAMAKKELMRKMESEARQGAAAQIHRIEEEARERSVEQARWVVAQAIQRYEAPQIAESTITVVTLPSDDMKARIIGREGRNIRSIEMAMGIDLIIDDTPGTIVVSSFNPTRRAIAKIALDRLVEDGRIHPARIEEMVAKVREDFDKIVTEQGESAGFDIGLHDMSPRLFKLAGRLNYMTFHGQNLLQHSREVAVIAAHIAGLLGVNTDTVKRAGFLHKIAFAEESNMDRSPLLASAELAQKLDQPEAVVHCIQALYGLVAPRTIEAAILPVAEKVSISRPGAQRDMLQTYLERLDGIETIARTMKGVKEVYAMRAGREVRVLVEPEKLGDKEVVWLSRDLAKRIENEVTYPGQIRISVIRETRSVDFAM
jgi:ribonuclease Y